MLIFIYWCEGDRRPSIDNTGYTHNSWSSQWIGHSPRKLQHPINNCRTKHMHKEKVNSRLTIVNWRHLPWGRSCGCAVVPLYFRFLSGVLCSKGPICLIIWLRRNTFNTSPYNSPFPQLFSRWGKMRHCKKEAQVQLQSTNISVSFNAIKT